jgi:predicted DNA-binding transcriptional regulator YafY
MGRKKDPDATPSGKLLSLYTRLLFRPEEVSLSTLSSELSCSKQTTSRLLCQLEASRFGKLIRVPKGKEAFFRLDRPTKEDLPQISLNVDSLRELCLCRDFMLHLLPASMRLDVETALSQVSAYLPAQELTEKKRVLAPKGTALIKGHIDYTPFQETFRTILKAVETQKICRVSYRSSHRSEARSSDYAPKRVMSYHETIRVSGWFVTLEGAKKFEKPALLLLHRMESAALTDRSAAHLPEPEEDNARVFGLISGEPFTVTVRFDASAAEYVADRVWSEHQAVEKHEDGSVTLTLTAQSEVEVVSWILSFGDAAEALSPQWLREEIAKKARAVARKYETQDL